MNSFSKKMLFGIVIICLLFLLNCNIARELKLRDPYVNDSDYRHVNVDGFDLYFDKSFSLKKQDILVTEFFRKFKKFCNCAMVHTGRIRKFKELAPKKYKYYIYNDNTFDCSETTPHRRCYSIFSYERDYILVNRDLRDLPWEFKNLWAHIYYCDHTDPDPSLYNLQYCMDNNN